METKKDTFWSNPLPTVKRYWYRYVVITLLLSLVAGFWLEWRQEQASAVSRVEVAYGVVQSSELNWLNETSILISTASQPEANYPSRQSLDTLEKEVRRTLDVMTSFYTPTNRIEGSARAYRNALSDIAGAINQYRTDEVSLRRLLTTLQTAANLGGGLKHDVDDYRTNAWLSFFSIII